MKDYYSILGVSKNASPDEIKKAYRKLAMQWHPDRHVSDTEENKKLADTKFKEIGEAYSILSDPDKKARYDRGENPDMTGEPNPSDGIDLNEILRNMASHMGGMHFGFGFGDEQQKPIEDIIVDISLTMAESYKGCDKTITFSRDEPCDKCGGHGGENGTDYICPDCHGKGHIDHMVDYHNGSYGINRTNCSKCHGTGHIEGVKKCPECNGTGVKKVKGLSFNVTIPAGVANGQVLTVQGQGNYRNGERGNVLIRISVKEDDYFQRPDPINVIHYENIDWIDCVLGCEKEIKYLDGSTFKLKIPEGTQDGTTFMKEGKGFPNMSGWGKKTGDYAVIVRYQYPKLNNKQKELLKQIKETK